MKKKLLLIIVVLLIVAAMGCAGVAGLLKLRQMYGAILQEFENTNARIHNTYIKTEKLAEQLSTDIYLARNRYQFDYEWTEGSVPLIAHAFGGVDGVEYTNSREAFLYNYERGFRVFEVDFNLLSDGQQVASHDEGRWRERTGVDASVPYDRESFMDNPLFGKYEPMDYRGVIDLMAEYPDIYIVTDSKEATEEAVKYQFSQMVWYAKQVDPSVLDRMVVQIYSEDMLNWVMDVYPFRSVLLTLYQMSWSPESVVDFCAENGIRFVTVYDSGYKPEIGRLWKEHGISVAVHTLNDTEQARQFMQDGVDWIYTDFLNPADFAR